MRRWPSSRDLFGYPQSKTKAECLAAIDLRLMAAVVPALYGPSADDTTFA